MVPQIKVQTDDILNYSKAARMLGVTRATIYSLIDKGKLHPLELADRRYLLKQEVEAIKQERAATKTALPASSEGSQIKRR